MCIRDRLESSERLVKLESRDSDNRFTTIEMLELEKSLLASADRLSRDKKHKSKTDIVAKVLLQFPTIRGEQAEAVRHITLKSNAVSCINGMAGTGKTFLLKVARSVWEKQGFEVIGTSLAAKACQVLEEGSGIKGAHLHLSLIHI